MASGRVHPATRARKAVLLTSTFAAAGLAGYLAVAAPSPASSSTGAPSSNSTSSDEHADEHGDVPTTQGTIPRRGRNRTPVPVPAPAQPQQSQPRTRSGGS